MFYFCKGYRHSAFGPTSETQGQIVGLGRRFTDKIVARESLQHARKCPWAPTQVHLPHQFQKTPGQFALDWPENCLFLANQRRAYLPGQLRAF